LVSVLAGGSILAVIIFVILSLPPFGGTVSGERLKRVQTNPQYEDGAFVNAQPQTPFNISDIGSFFSESFFYDEIRIPPSRIPVVPVTPSSLKLASKPILRAFWIGHASVYVEIDSIRMLIDPVFSNYASPL